MNWFERLMGFSEAQGSYKETQARLRLVDGRLSSDTSPRDYAAGELELASLADLRERTKDLASGGQLRLGIEQGDVRRLHTSSENAGAVFQVASQFNLLEMVGPGVTPEDGVGGYEHDRTQGPACAIAAGAGTIYRNYLVPVGNQTGQTAEHQLDASADLHARLASHVGLSQGNLWDMRNGYALPTREELTQIEDFLSSTGSGVIDELRSLVRVGLHRDVEVTEGPSFPGPRVTQVYCSAMPVYYSRISTVNWRSLASLVLEAAYEATLRIGVLNAARGTSNRVLLTRLGGGAFGNDDRWIDDAMARALAMHREADLDVRIVSYGSPSSNLREFVSGVSMTL